MELWKAHCLEGNPLPYKTMLHGFKATMDFRYVSYMKSCFRSILMQKCRSQFETKHAGMLVGPGLNLWRGWWTEWLGCWCRQ